MIAQLVFFGRDVNDDGENYGWNILSLIWSGINILADTKEKTAKNKWTVL